MLQCPFPKIFQNPKVKRTSEPVDNVSGLSQAGHLSRVPTLPMLFILAIDPLQKMSFEEKEAYRKHDMCLILIIYIFKEILVILVKMLVHCRIII